MRTIKPLILVLAMHSLLGVATITAGQEMQPHRGGRSGEEYLKREVGHELTQVPWYSVFDILQYSVNGTEVTLKGEVVQPTIKSDAENAVKRIEGVEKVNNQIEVLPPSPMDDQIRRAEYRAIYSQPTLSRYGVGNLQSIHILVKGGHVTLEGSVDSEQDKNVANIAANTVPNVFSVENQLNVAPSSK
jgi:hyperosmotically inducible periplasmic protein